MNEELEAEARKEFGETPELIKDSLNKFRQLLQEEKDLRLPPDYVLLTFLRGRKYRVDEALKTLKNYFRALNSLPEYFENFSPSAIDFQKVMREHKLLMLSKDRDPQGRPVGMIRYGAWDISKCSLNELVRCGCLVLECLLLEDETQIRGFVCVDDFEGLGVHHLIELTPRFIRLLIALVQDTFPLRLKAFYIVNTPTVFHGIFNLFVKPFLSEKLKKRVHLLKGGLSELCGVIPSDLIPEKYGGTLEQFDFDRMERYLLDKSRHFEIIRQCGYATNCSTT